MKNLLRPALAGVSLLLAAAQAADRPNIIFILSDDVGYGDLVCYGANQVKTPNLDRLAREGRQFMDAHSPASVCTPTRFAFMTGQYAWRHKGTGIAPGNATLLIPVSTPTVPSVLKQAGYQTGIVGKWHLGLGTTEPDFNQEIKPGPLELGFGYSFIIPATGDRVPCVFIENHRVAGLDPADPIRVSYGKPVGNEPTGLTHPERLIIKADKNHSQAIVNGVSRIGYMTGGTAALWKDQDIADVLTRKAVAFLEKQKAGTPFFLYFTPHDIHEPMVPHPRFRGTSGCGWRGDVIHQLDWSVGEVLNALDRLGFTQNTLVIFTSDNGGAIKNTYDDGTNHLHAKQPPNGTLRGQKGSLYEGGHRVPFLARWPARIPAGSKSEALFAHLDMLPTFASLAGTKVPAGGAPDAVNVTAALTGPAGAKGRDSLVLQNNNQAPLALRAGGWKLLFKPNGTHELYHLAADPREEKDVAASDPERVKAMAAQLAKIRGTP
ncbi:MAG: arylsulfatase [Verrucomicrobia bacterium]|nr:arylsulfatase [Verrucomicrobiota bacterium]